MTEKSERIAALNDQFRTTFQGGRVLMTSGIQTLPEETRLGIFGKVMSFDDFTEDNDPHGEHDFGMLEIEDVGKVFWKIDYYAPDLQHGSEDPTDSKLTVRVLTIMFSYEY